MTARLYPFPGRAEGQRTADGELERLAKRELRLSLVLSHIAAVADWAALGTITPEAALNTIRDTLATAQGVKR